MNKSKLIPSLALVAVAATVISLPVTASADPVRHEPARSMVGHNQPHDATNYRVHDVDRRHKEERYYDHKRWTPLRHHHDHGRHYGYQQLAPRVVYAPVMRQEYREPRIVYAPVVRQEYREPRVGYAPVERQEYRGPDYRQVERYQSRPDDDLRIRIVYDLKL